VRKRVNRDAIETRAMSPQEFTPLVAGEIDERAPLVERVIQASSRARNSDVIPA
jgi:hypothetical protein